MSIEAGIKVELGGKPPMVSSRPGVPVPGEVTSLMNDALTEFKRHFLHEVTPLSVWMVMEQPHNKLAQCLTTRRQLIKFFETDPTVRASGKGTLAQLRNLPSSADVLPWVAVVTNPATGALRIGFGRFLLGSLKATA